jgi:hypothetical protein
MSVKTGGPPYDGRVDYQSARGLPRAVLRARKRARSSSNHIKIFLRPAPTKFTAFCCANFMTVCREQAHILATSWLVYKLILI